MLGGTFKSVGSFSPGWMQLAPPEQKCNMMLPLLSPFPFTSPSFLDGALLSLCLPTPCAGGGGQGIQKMCFRCFERGAISVLAMAAISPDMPLGPTNMFILPLLQMILHTQYAGEMVFTL